MKKNKVMLFVLALALCLAVALAGQAQEAPPKDPVGFTVRAILPENQLEAAGYFQLLLQPDQRQTVEVEVGNLRGEPLTVSVAIQNAFTNGNGLIAYLNSEGAALYGPRATEYAALRLDRLEGAETVEVNPDNTLTIAPWETIRVPVEITLGSEPMDGQVLGGISVMKVNPDEEMESASFAVRSLYSYVIALQMQSVREVNTAPSFTLVGVEKASIGGWPALVATLRNEAPLIITGGQLRLRVTAAGQETPLMDVTRERVSIAPHSDMPLAVAIPDDVTLAPGVYTVSVAWTYRGETMSMHAELHIENPGQQG